jgi:hypothetical protein
MIEGRDFPGRILGEPSKRVGFFATRWREAEDEQAAELAAVDALRDEYRDVAMPLRDGEFTPMLNLAGIEELQAFPNEYPKTGAAWFPMREDD